MEKFKVIDPRGITINGVLKEKGETVNLAKGAERNAFLHFKQIEATPDKESGAEPKTPDKKSGAESPPAK